MLDSKLLKSAVVVLCVVTCPVVSLLVACPSENSGLEVVWWVDVMGVVVRSEVVGPLVGGYTVVMSVVDSCEVVVGGPLVGGYTVVLSVVVSCEVLVVGPLVGGYTVVLSVVISPVVSCDVEPGMVVAMCVVVGSRVDLVVVVSPAVLPTTVTLTSIA